LHEEPAWLRWFKTALIWKLVISAASEQDYFAALTSQRAFKQMNHMSPLLTTYSSQLLPASSGLWWQGLEMGGGVLHQS